MLSPSKSLVSGTLDCSGPQVSPVPLGKLRPELRELPSVIQGPGKWAETVPRPSFRPCVLRAQGSQSSMTAAVTTRLGPGQTERSGWAWAPRRRAGTRRSMPGRDREPPAATENRPALPKSTGWAEGQEPGTQIKTQRTLLGQTLAPRPPPQPPDARGQLLCPPQAQGHGPERD